MISKSRNSVLASNAGTAKYHHKRANLHASWDSLFPLPRPSGFVSALVVGVSAIACYANSLDGGFVFDDSEAIVNNRDLRPETPMWNLFRNDFWGTRLTHNASHKSFRPLTVLSFRWNYWLGGGLHPTGFHLTNVLLHAAVSVLTLPAFNAAFGGNCRRAALLSSLLFAVHPVHSEAVAGVVGRADLLCAVFYLASLLCYVDAANRRRRNAASLLVLAAAMGAAVVATFCKEQGVTVIGICSAYDILVKHKIHPSRLIWPFRNRERASTFHKPSSEDRKSPIDEASTPVNKFCNGSSGNCTSKSSHHSELESCNLSTTALLLRQAVLLATALCVLTFRLRLMATGPPTFQPVDNPASFHDSIITRVLSYNYIYALNGWLLLCPDWLCFDWSMGCVPLVLDTNDRRNVATLAFWLGLLFAGWKVLIAENSRSRRCVAMAVALTVVPFLPATNLFFRVGFVVAERVLYLPSAGFCMLVVLGVRQLATLHVSRTLLQTAYVFLVVVFGVRASLRSSEWRAETALFNAALRVCPLNAKVHYNIAKCAADAGDRGPAVERYRRALALNPRYDQAMNNLANILKDGGDLRQAEALLRRAVQIRPDFAAAWMNLGIVLSGLQRPLEAEESYKTALAHRRKYPDCYYNLGNLYLEQKQYTAALRAWRNATALKPTHIVAWNNMIIMLDNIGEASRAEAVAHEALSSLPSEASLHFNLANMLGKAARFAEAEKHFVEAIRLDRGNALYYTNLGVLYHRWKKMDRAEGFYRRALELNPQLKSAKDNLALLYKNLSKTGAARR